MKSLMCKVITTQRFAQPIYIYIYIYVCVCVCGFIYEFFKEFSSCIKSY